MAGRRTVGAVDNIWLRMDRPANLMVIDTVMWLDAPLDLERFRAVVQRRIVDRFPVFSQRIAPDTLPLLSPQWEDDPEFDLDRHVSTAMLPEPAGEAELKAYVESVMHVPLDRRHPLWDMHVIEGYGGGAAVVSRFHHAIADGIALAQVLLSLTDAEADDDLVVTEDGTARQCGLDAVRARASARHAARSRRRRSSCGRPSSGTRSPSCRRRRTSRTSCCSARTRPVRCWGSRAWTSARCGRARTPSRRSSRSGARPAPRSTTCSSRPCPGRLRRTCSTRAGPRRT